MRLVDPHGGFRCVKRARSWVRKVKSRGAREAFRNEQALEAATIALKSGNAAVTLTPFAPEFRIVERGNGFLPARHLRIGAIDRPM